MRSHYKEEGALRGPEQPIKFESDVIELDIPLDGTTVSGGWRLRPLTPPVVSAFDCTIVLLSLIHI